MIAAPFIHTAFYKFVTLEQPEEMAVRLRAITVDLLGHILVASEGINGGVAGTGPQIDAFENALRADVHFSDIVFKRSPSQTKPFARMKVRCKKEIVNVGVDNAVPNAANSVAPEDWRKLIQQDDVVVLDNRNSFEYRLGHFANAIDPKVTHFRDFPEYVQAHAKAWREQGKRVAMYCTGGIRCEKTSTWMRDMGLDVYQLEGGILNYFQAMPDADKDWQGKCFVFDNRVAVDTHLHDAPVPLEEVYEAEPDGPWRIARARRLSGQSE